MAKISRDSFNKDIRQRVGAVLTSGQTYWTSTDAEYAERYKYGYGVALGQTSEVTTSSLVDDAEWDRIRLDLIKARTHQKGISWVTANLGLQDDRTGVNNANDVTVGDKILTSVYTKYSTVASDLLTDKFLVASGEFEDTTPAELASSVTTVTFSAQALWQTDIYWANATQANQFFNAGGSFTVSIDASHSGSLSGEYRRQSEAVLAILMNGGTPYTWTFGATDWYANASTTPRVWVSKAASGAYSADKLEIRVFTNLGTAGVANRLTIRMVLLSSYTGGIPSGTGAGSIGYGDSVSLILEPQVVERHSTNTIISPLPTQYTYGNWSSS